MDEFEKELSAASEQGSQVWHDVRAGRFTASKIYLLMEGGMRPMTAEELKARPKSGKGSKTTQVVDPNQISKPARTYISQKVAETLTGQAAPQVQARATEHGEYMEPIAAEVFKERTGLDFEILSFVPYTDHAGGSPDRKIKDRNEILEIKCPYNPENQVDYLLLVDQWDLKNLYPEYYWQCQANLLFTGAELCHFVTYDHRMIEEKNQLFYMPIKAIQEDQDLIIKKIEMAVGEKLRALQIIGRQPDTLKQLFK